MLAEVRAFDQRTSLDGATTQKAHNGEVAAAQRRQPLTPICSSVARISVNVYVFRRPGSRPSGRRRAFRRLSPAFTFTARGGKARSAAAENVC
jgi:hypothetical protein